MYASEPHITNSIFTVFLCIRISQSNHCRLHTHFSWRTLWEHYSNLMKGKWPKSVLDSCICYKSTPCHRFDVNADLILETWRCWSYLGKKMFFSCSLHKEQSWMLLNTKSSHCCKESNRPEKTERHQDLGKEPSSYDVLKVSCSLGLYSNRQLWSTDVSLSWAAFQDSLYFLTLYWDMRRCIAPLVCVFTT